MGKATWPMALHSSCSVACVAMPCQGLTLPAVALPKLFLEVVAWDSGDGKSSDPGALIWI